MITTTHLILLGFGFNLIVVGAALRCVARWSDEEESDYDE